MHILIVFTGELKTKIFPLGGKFQLDHALALRKSGIKAGIIAPGLLSVRRLFKKYPFKKFQKYGNVPVFRDYKQNLLPARIKIYNLLLAKRYETFGMNVFEQYKKKYGKPDLIHCFDVRFGIFVAKEINKKYNIPYITTEFSSETAENTFPMVLKNRAVSILKKSKLVTAACKPFASKFKKKLKLNRIKVLPFYPLLSTDITSEKLIRSKTKKNDFTFLTANRLDKNKNIKFMILAFYNLLKKKPNIKLKIIGDGSESNKLKKLILKLNIKNKVTFIHNASRDILKNELKNANCFLSSSYVETFGLIIAESIAYGVPVVSTKSEGATEIINLSNGILVNHNKVQDYSNAMLKVYLNNLNYNRTKMRKDIVDRFGFKTFIKNVKKIYSNAIKNK